MNLKEKGPLNTEYGKHVQLDRLHTPNPCTCTVAASYLESPLTFPGDPVDPHLADPVFSTDMFKDLIFDCPAESDTAWEAAVRQIEDGKAKPSFSDYTVGTYRPVILTVNLGGSFDQIHVYRIYHFLNGDPDLIQPF